MIGSLTGAQYGSSRVVVKVFGEEGKVEELREVKEGLEGEI